MKIKFIGTGSGQTSLKRFHSSILISDNNYNLLIDAGEGISKAFLYNKIDYNLIDGILISHFHADHVFGLNSLLTQMKMNHRKSTLQIFIHKEMKECLLNLFELGYIFIDHLDFNVKIVCFEVKNKITVSSNIAFLAKQNNHVNNKHSVSTFVPFISLSFLFNLENETVLYSSDIASKEDLLPFKNNQINRLIIEGTHIPPKEIDSISDELNSKYVYITHINEDDSVLLEWLNNFKGIKKNNTRLASDGLEINL